MKTLLKHFVFALFICATNILAQFNHVLDKPGKYSVKYWSVYSENFSKAETNTFLKKLSAVPELLRQNKTIGSPLGFDCDVDVHSQDGVGEYGSRITKKLKYGFPAVINFHICFFYLDEKGKLCRFSIEPPHWDILVNRLAPFTDGGPLTKNGDLFFLSTNKITLEPGIDVYDDENVFMFNPNQPPYLIPVTIKEVFTEIIDYYKKDEDQIAASYALKILEDEYAQFSTSEREMPAYLGGRGNMPLSNVDTKKSSKQVMRVNPEYWNRKLSRSAIQTLAFKCNLDKDFIDKEIAALLKNGSVDYHTCRIMRDLNIKSLLTFIEK